MTDSDTISDFFSNNCYNFIIILTTLKINAQAEIAMETIPSLLDEVFRKK